MSEEAKDGDIKSFGSEEKILYEGRWLPYYKEDSTNPEIIKKRVEGFRRRYFRLVETGTNLSADNIEPLQKAYDNFDDPDEKQASGEQLAGAIFNHACDKIEDFVECKAQNPKDESLPEQRREIEGYLLRVKELSKGLRLDDWSEDVDEVVEEAIGEPFKAFMALEFTEAGVYRKRAMAMNVIDEVAEALISTADIILSSGDELEGLIRELAHKASADIETRREDKDKFLKVWPERIAAEKKLLRFTPEISKENIEKVKVLKDLVKKGVTIIDRMVKERLPNKNSAEAFKEECKKFERISMIDEIGDALKEILLKPYPGAKKIETELRAGLIGVEEAQHAAVSHVWEINDREQTSEKLELFIKDALEFDPAVTQRCRDIADHAKSSVEAGIMLIREIAYGKAPNQDRVEDFIENCRQSPELSLDRL